MSDVSETQYEDWLAIIVENCIFYDAHPRRTTGYMHEIFVFFDNMGYCL